MKDLTKFYNRLLTRRQPSYTSSDLLAENYGQVRSLSQSKKLAGVHHIHVDLGESLEERGKDNKSCMPLRYTKKQASIAEVSKQRSRSQTGAKHRNKHDIHLVKRSNCPYLSLVTRSFYSAHHVTVSFQLSSFTKQRITEQQF